MQEVAFNVTSGAVQSQRASNFAVDPAANGQLERIHVSENVRSFADDERCALHGTLNAAINVDLAG